jgi:hypothetical protein
VPSRWRGEYGWHSATSVRCNAPGGVVSDLSDHRGETRHEESAHRFPAPLTHGFAPSSPSSTASGGKRRPRPTRPGGSVRFRASSSTNPLCGGRRLYSSDSDASLARSGVARCGSARPLPRAIRVLDRKPRWRRSDRVGDEYGRRRIGKPLKVNSRLTADRRTPNQRGQREVLRRQRGFPRPAAGATTHNAPCREPATNRGRLLQRSKAE